MGRDAKLMKRVLICASLVAAFVLPSSVMGQVGRGVYIGEIDGVADSQMKLKTSIADGETDVTSFFVRNVPVSCEGGREAILNRIGLRGEISVSDRRRFKAEDDNGETTFQVEGRVGKKKSIGSFRYFGDVSTGEGGTLDCDTGRLEYTARL